MCIPELRPRISAALCWRIFRAALRYSAGSHPYHSLGVKAKIQKNNPNKIVYFRTVFRYAAGSNISVNY